MTRPEPGETYTHERTVTREDVERFAALSGDDQPRHVDPDEEGRVVAQGLLTATLPTKIGGDLGVLARTMTFEFVRPVYAGDAVTCEVEIETVEPRGDRYAVEASTVCANGDGDVVLRGSFAGLVDG